MFRCLFQATKTVSSVLKCKNVVGFNKPAKTLVSSVAERHFSLMQPRVGLPILNNSSKSPLLETVRTVTKYSLRKGKRKTVKTVVTRFFRLNWGGWIRRRAGCHKRKWKESSANLRRQRQHVLCNATQNRLLDSMVNNYWRRRKYYIDDPYEPYHTREEFLITSTKPKPYFPPEKE